VSRRRTAFALAAVALLVIAACSGGKKKAAPTTTTTAAPSTTAPPPTYPLTGLPATDQNILKRPALVVKIDNADGGPGNTARPQLGLNEADVVYEEMVEGSVTRLAAIFHSTDADPVGPIRSARLTDISVFSPLNRPLFAWSGGNPGVSAAIRGSALVDVGYDAQPGAYERRNETGHVAPHNLYSGTPQLFSLAPPDAAPPNPLFTYRAAGEPAPATAKPIGSIHLVFGSGPGSSPVDYSWAPDVGGFARSQRGSDDVDENGNRMTPQNVIVQFVSYHDTGDTDVAGNPVPEADLVGGGDCWALTNGVLVECHWSKASPEAIPQYVDGAGAPIKLTPGRTWVELVPIGGGTVTG